MISENKLIKSARVIGNEAVCREHFRLTLRCSTRPEALPGQFVFLGAETSRVQNTAEEHLASDPDPGRWLRSHGAPLLRRAFSIAGMRKFNGGADIDVLYRVVGAGTRWMAALRSGESVNLLGPLGNRFPIPADRQNAFLVAGGVGLPPMLWLAEALGAAGKRTVAFCGAQTADLLALTVDERHPPATDARHAAASAHEFACNDTPVVISTDDGSLGYHGHIGSALEAYHDANPIAADDIVVYTCGPERMMRFVAEWCEARKIECWVCMERTMACGLGTCQSCVVPVRDSSDDEGWRYLLCCKDGPVFDANQVFWDPPKNR